MAFTVPIFGFLGLETGLLYVPRWVPSGPQSWMRLDYLDLPVLARVDAPWSFPLRPVAVLGLAPGYLAACEELPSYLGTGMHPIPEATRRECRMDRLHRWDVSTVIGAGVEMQLGRISVSAESRRTYGRRDVYPGRRSTETLNRTRGFVVGVQFHP